MDIFTLTFKIDLLPKSAFPKGKKKKIGMDKILYMQVEVNSVLNMELIINLEYACSKFQMFTSSFDYKFVFSP